MVLLTAPLECLRSRVVHAKKRWLSESPYDVVDDNSKLRQDAEHDGISDLVPPRANRRERAVTQAFSLRSLYSSRVASASDLPRSSRGRSFRRAFRENEHRPARAAPSPRATPILVEPESRNLREISAKGVLVLKG